MPLFSATMLMGSKPDPETMEKIQRTQKMEPGQAMEFSIFEVDCESRKYYCCWAGGKIENGEPLFTLIGQGALECLINLPMGDDEALIIQELTLGKTPLHEKFASTFRRAPPNSKICFLGDLQGELDGHMAANFNLTGVRSIAS